MKRIITIILAAIMIFTCAACGSGNGPAQPAAEATAQADQTEAKTEAPKNDDAAEAAEAAEEDTSPGSNVNPKGVFPIVKEQITMSVFVKQLPWVGDLVENEFVKYLQDYTGIKFLI